MAKHGLKAFDSDMHVYDAADLYDKYMNPKWWPSHSQRANATANMAG